MTVPMLEVRQLSVNFGGLRAVSDVSFSIERNRITAVIGPNGAGKSTLFNLISGALQPRAGCVLIEGIDYTGQPAHRMQKAGLARSFQITNLFFELSVAENLRLAAQILEPLSMAWQPVKASRSAHGRVQELLTLLGLTDKADYPAGKLSHGEQRRLEVGVALACKPKILLLDEPTQGMSHGDTADTAKLIKSLANDVTVLLIEHDIGLVMSLSDHVIVMHQGEILAEGPPADVHSNPAVQTAYFGHA
jgi:branched-chain amino acid transport system ATP-binding protein